MKFELLNSLDLNFDEALMKKFSEYEKLFKKYNSHTNLISNNDEKLLFEKHIYDSLAFNLFSKKYNCPKSIMDIGTGGGFPGVPLAFIYPDTYIMAVDSTTKKINFVKEIKECLDIKNLEPVVSRIEELPKDKKEGFDVVTTRALGELSLILEYGIPYLKVGGYFVAYKSKDSENELEKAKSILKILKTKLEDVIDYKLPLAEKYDRKLLIFKKTGKTPDIYPRPYNIIKKTLM